MRHDLCKFSHSSKHLREALFQSRWQAAKKSRLVRALNWYMCRVRAKEFLAMAVDIIDLVIPSDYALPRGNSKADIGAGPINVRFVPKSDIEPH